MKSKRVSSEPKDCLRHSLMRRSDNPVEAIRLESCEKFAILTGLGSLRVQIKEPSSEVWYSLNDDEPTRSSSSEPHDKVKLPVPVSGSSKDD